jgi:RNA polymerase sigma-70 factor, ECF subfamily
MIFDDIYKAYWEKVFRLCMGYVNDYNWAKDIAQEVFIIVWRELPKFRQEASVGTWIFKIASNQCLRQIETSKRKQTNVLPVDATADAQPDTDHNVELLYQYIAALPEMDRLIISMELEDLKQAEIAQITGISEGNIRVRIHRIKEKLSKQFSLYEA